MDRQGWTAGARERLSGFRDFLVRALSGGAREGLHAADVRAYYRTTDG
jgi:hypothetical protein